MHRTSSYVLWTIVALLAASGCKKETTSEKGHTTATATTHEAPREKAAENREIFDPLPESYPASDNPLTPEKIALGRQLYYEKRLSKGHDISCNTCHLLDQYGVDGKKTSEGHKEERGPRNAPTVYNAAGHVAQFWDGRADDVETQAKGPVLNPIEMAMPDEEYVLLVLKSIPGYREGFAKAFPDQEAPVTFDNMANAIGAFERRLVTPGKWDRYLEGEEKALTDAEIEGFNTFVEVGCTSCHSGELVGASSYQKLGLVEDWPDKDDLGRFEVTKSAADRMKFKVPSLRNITRTGPYFHDGSVETLREAVVLMGKHQLGKDLDDTQIDSILVFLAALEGELPKEYIARPEMPESGENTPEPAVN